MSRSPPLRFLAIVLGGWAALRAAWLAPPWPAPTIEAVGAATRAEARPPVFQPEPQEPWPRPPLPAKRETSLYRGVSDSPAAPRRPSPALRSMLAASPAMSPIAAAQQQSAAAGAAPPQPFAVRPAADPAARAGRRWSLSAWSFVRRGSGAALAAGGLLGGSQAGARLAYRVGEARSLAISARIAAPLRSPAGAEAAVGLDWQPSRRLPLHLLAERRQKLGREGRSAFAITLYGGVSEAPLGRFRIDAYAQAGMVGVRSRDLFADGALRVSLPVGERVRLGAGAWAAAQPGVARLDLGPQAVLRLPVPGRNVTLAADWRLRLAGNARPGSGPTLTLATDF